MRLSYTKLVPANLRGRLREITHFEASEPGKGHGTELLRQVCDEANRANIVLMLMPTSARVGALYVRFGFLLIQDDPALMLRTPRLYKLDD